jgi:hypothetical protein
MDEVIDSFNPWWRGEFRTGGIQRDRYFSEMKDSLKWRDVLFLVGMRRVGKTTLMKQFITDRLAETDPNRILFLSMDHPAFNGYSIIQIVDRFRGMRGLSKDEDVIVFLDEVHLHTGFERDLKVLYDMEHTKIYASGSSSIFLLEKGAFLTGRQHFIEVMPFDLEEYIAYIDPDAKMMQSDLIMKHAENRVINGGLPEYLEKKDPGYIVNLVDSIIYKDLVSRHAVNDARVLKDMILLLSQGVGNRFSARKIARTLDITHPMVKEYLSYFIETKMLDVIECEGKYALQKRSPKKIYFTDTGMVKVLSPSINLGALVENMVFNHIRRTDEPRYLIHNGKEIDFVFGDTAIEVKYKDRILEDDLKPLRSIEGYKNRILISRSVEQEIDGVNILPFWKFLMDKTN